MSDLITVIVTIYNRFDLANRAISSVLNQSYQNWQLIIIDDCSSLCFELNNEIQNFKQDIIVLRNIVNVGPGLSRQRGLDLASGDYVCFLDSDDFWKPSFLELSLETIKQNPEICATYCQSEMIDGSLRRRNLLSDQVSDIYYGVVSGARPWATCALLWRKKYLATWDAIRTNQDALFEIQTAINNPKIKIIPEVLCVIDKHTGSNANDIVGINKGNINRTLVLLKATKLLNEYCGGMEYEIKHSLWNSLFYQLKKMIKQNEFLLATKILLILLFNFKWRKLA